MTLLDRQHSPNIVDAPDSDTIATRVADAIALHCTQVDQPVVVLPTGATMYALYARLRARLTAGDLDLAHVTFVQLDEVLLANPAHSFRAILRRELLDHVRGAEARGILFDHATLDPIAHCQRIRARLQDAGGITLVVLGIGLNGHVGFNEPPTGPEAVTRPVRLATSTRNTFAGYFALPPADAPRGGMTIGMAEILQADQRIIVATGASKASIVSEALTGGSTPAGIALRAAATTLYLDQDASGAGSAR